MQFTSWHRYIYRMIAGSVFLLWGFAGLLLNPGGGTLIPAILLAAGLAFLVTGITRWRKYGNAPEQDERSRMIGAWGLSYSWILGLFFMTTLFWLDYFRFVALTAGLALGASVIVMTLSAVAFQLYLSRFGDVA